MAITSAASRRPLRVRRASSVSPYHQERRAVVGDVVVEDLHRSGVVDGVRDVAFAQEACGHLGVDRQLGVQDLDRDLGLVAVNGRVHRRHPTYTHDALELPLATEHRAQAGFSAIRDVLGERHGVHQTFEQRSWFERSYGTLYGALFRSLAFHASSWWFTLSGCPTARHIRDVGQAPT
jgi:hypothetical protein